jgi:hypothetical protein
MSADLLCLSFSPGQAVDETAAGTSPHANIHVERLKVSHTGTQMIPIAGAQAVLDRVKIGGISVDDVYFHRRVQPRRHVGVIVFSRVQWIENADA